MREKLVQVALDLFARHGYAGTSVRAIAAAAGLSDAGLYGHFRGKRAIYDELLRRAGPISLDAAGLDIDELATRPVEDGLADIVRALLSMWEQPAARAFTSVLLRDGGPTGVLADEVERARTRIAPLFDRWIDARAIPADHDPEELVWELVTPLVALRFLHLRAEGDATDTATARRLADRHRSFFLHALRHPRNP